MIKNLKRNRVSETLSEFKKRAIQNKSDHQCWSCDKMKRDYQLYILTFPEHIQIAVPLCLDCTGAGMKREFLFTGSMKRILKQVDENETNLHKNVKSVSTPPKINRPSNIEEGEAKFFTQDEYENSTHKPLFEASPVHEPLFETSPVHESISTEGLTFMDDLRYFEETHECFGCTERIPLAKQCCAEYYCCNNPHWNSKYNE